jgi:cytochrome b561
VAFLIALHVAGALKHHFLNGDDVLKRMLPRWRIHRSHA